MIDLKTYLDFFPHLKSNVLSIHKSIPKIKDSVLYYPACGKDLFRAMVAYDSTYTVGVDLMPFSEWSMKPILEVLNKRFSLNESSSTREFIFDFMGKERYVEENRSSVKDVVVPLHDILHLYNPMRGKLGVENILDCESSRLSSDGIICVDESKLNLKFAQPISISRRPLISQSEGYVHSGPGFIYVLDSQS